MNSDHLRERLEANITLEPVETAALDAIKQRGLHRRRVRRARRAAGTLLASGAVLLAFVTSAASRSGTPQIKIERPSGTGTTISDRPLPLPGYPPGTALVAEAHAGVIAGYIDAKYIVGPDSGGAPPAGMPGYPVTNKQGTLLYGYDIPLVGAVRRSIAEDPQQVAVLKSCVGGEPLGESGTGTPTTARLHPTTYEESPQCKAIRHLNDEPFGLHIAIPNAQPPSLVTSELFLPGRKLRSGRSMRGRLVITNASGSAIDMTYCRTFFQAGLERGGIRQSMLWLRCAQQGVIPKGRSEYPVTVSARYSPCIDVVVQPTGSCTRASQPLPPGTYTVVAGWGLGSSYDTKAWGPQTGTIEITP